MGFLVPYVDFPKQFKNNEKEIIDAVKKVFSSGSFILRDEVQKFEDNMAAYLGVKYVIGVNSGTDALHLSLLAVGITNSDEVITVSHTFVGTIAPIIHCGATVLFADIKADFTIDCSDLEKLVTPKTKAVIPVHLNGRCCNMDEIIDFAKTYNLFIIEDAAQAVGANFRGKSAGSFGHTGCFSLHPMKNLGCAGDGGFVATNDCAINKKLRLYRDHGQHTKSIISCFGYNSRLDNIQAAIVNVRMNNLNVLNIRRRALAKLYDEGLKEVSDIILPPVPKDKSDYYDVFSSYVICANDRDRLYSYCLDKGVEVFISWPVALHKQKALNLSSNRLPVTDNISNKVLSLPIAPELTDEQIRLVISVIKGFYYKGA